MRRNYVRYLFVFIVCLFFLFTSVFGDDVVVDWTSTYNSPNNSYDEGISIAVDHVGNVYVTGYEDRSDLGQDHNIWTRKYDSNGYVVWTSTYNSPNNSRDLGIGIAVDTLGNVYVTGGENRTDLGHGSHIWTRKYDSNGYEIWTSTYNSPNNNIDVGSDITVDSTGNVYVIGYEYRDDLGEGNNIWTRKYDSNGYEVWTSTYNSPNNSADFGISIAVDTAGNVYVTGSEYRSDIGELRNIWIRKYDSNGYEVWTSTYNSSNNSYDEGFGIAVDTFGNVYVTGYEDRSDLGQDHNIWTRKYNSSGYEVWTSTYNSPNNREDYGYDITVDPAGNVYVVGAESRSDLGQGYNIWVRKYDNNGNEIWTITYNSPNNDDDRGYGIAVDTAGNVYVTGYEKRNDLGQYGNVWTRKYKALYNLNGTITDGANPISNITVNLTGDFTASIITDSNGNYSFNDLTAGLNYVITPTNLYWKFMPMNMTYTNLSGDVNDANFTGTFNQWSISGTITDGVNTLPNVTVKLRGDSKANTIVDSNGNYSFNNLNAGATYIIIPTKTNSIFTPVKRTYTNLNCDINDADFITFAENLKDVFVYPNPWKPETGEDSIIFAKLTVNSYIKIYTISGELLIELKPDNINYPWNLKTEAGKSVASGVYLYVISNDKGEKRIGKFVIIK
ncbi:SBBP repeat-containing protein [Candidatus Dependentiae bacterium]|nr:SBBP repeat-containing protein [Candidatus Dependentiae bacterium]